MYNYNMILNYKTFENDDQYQIQFCKLFNIQEYDDTIIMNSIDELFDKYKSNIYFKKLIQMAKQLFNTEDDNFAFVYLFSWDYLYDLHNCLNELNNNSTINDELLNIFTPS